jgi:hypothetical protein
MNARIISATVLTSENAGNAINITVQFSAGTDHKVYCCKRGWFDNIMVGKLCRITTDGKVRFYDAVSNTLYAELG